MTELFYASAVIAVISALMVVTRANAMHALLYLVLLFLAIASLFFTLGAPFLAALQIIVYAGAIMVLFVFAVMMLNLSKEAEREEKGRLGGLIWVLPGVLAAVLLAFFIYALAGQNTAPANGLVLPKAVGRSLFTTYMIAVELASVLLLAGLVAAFHFGTLPSRVEVSDEYTD